VYVPRFNALDDPDEIDRLVAAVGVAHLVTVSADGRPEATLLPLLRDGERLVFHMARANPHWRTIRPGSPALAVVTGPDAYVSPAWYRSKAEHGRVVPTWNYSAVHFTGRAEVHEDPGWLLDAVTRLTDAHERPRAEPWSVDDAPGPYIDKQLRAIVGVELRIEQVEAKAKLSQNRDDADVAGVIAGLRREGAAREGQVADAMAALRPVAAAIPPGADRSSPS
jgi:transcriptional regulator